MDELASRNFLQSRYFGSFTQLKRTTQKLPRIEALKRNARPFHLVAVRLL